MASLFFYMGGPIIAWRFCARVSRRLYPELPLAGSHSPPFRDLTNPEEREVAARINASGARIVFVGLGCPKQEVWMARQRGRIKAVMIGVGAAFDFHAGVVKRAPRWMQNSGLEWLYRFAAEPRRLWQRYLVTNSLFVLRPRLAARTRNSAAHIPHEGIWSDETPMR